MLMLYLIPIIISVPFLPTNPNLTGAKNCKTKTKNDAQFGNCRAPWIIGWLQLPKFLERYHCNYKLRCKSIQSEMDPIIVRILVDENNTRDKEKRPGKEIFWKGRSVPLARYKGNGFTCAVKSQSNRKQSLWNEMRHILAGFYWDWRKTLCVKCLLKIVFPKRGGGQPPLTSPNRLEGRGEQRGIYRISETRIFFGFCCEGWFSGE